MTAYTVSTDDTSWLVLVMAEILSESPLLDALPRMQSLIDEVFAEVTRERDLARVELAATSETLTMMSGLVHTWHDEANDLRAEASRLRAQLNASETAARITELQQACSRHEAEARAARAALRDAREFFRAAIASERDGGAYPPLPRPPLPPPLPPTPGPGQRVMDRDPGKGAIALLVGIWSKKGTP